MKTVYIVLLSFLVLTGCKKDGPVEVPAPPKGNINTAVDTLYVGGSFIMAGNTAVNNIAKWDGKNWYPLGSGVIGKDVDVECMTFYAGELYVGGFIDYAGGRPASNIARWDGKQWYSVGTGIDGRVTSLIVFNNELYAGGWFNNAGGKPAANIAKWNGISWSQVGQGMSDEVYTLAEFKGALYAGGWFLSPGSKVAKWDGVKWDTVVSNIGPVHPDGSGYVLNLTVVNDDLYAMGNFLMCNGFQANNIAKWDGNSWSNLDNGINENFVDCGASFNDELNVGGGFSLAGSVSVQNYAVWNGTNWNPGNLSISGAPYVLYPYNNKLYVGGEFSTVNGVQVKGIFEWDGKNIQTLDNGVKGYAKALVIH